MSYWYDNQAYSEVTIDRDIMNQLLSDAVSAAGVDLSLHGKKFANLPWNRQM